MTSFKHQLLLASSRMDDPSFSRALILMLEHAEQGAMGLVLNRPQEASIAACWKQVSETPCVHDSPVFWGGPCEGPLMALHNEPALADLVLHGSLSLTHEAEAMSELVGRSAGEAKFIVGYAGWGPGQLELEFEHGVWRVCRMDDALIFCDPDKAWLAALKCADPLEAMFETRPSLRPSDPSMN